MPEDERNWLAWQALSRVGLRGHVDHRPAELSGGQQQRVSIARAIITEPSIVLADEPTGNLDHQNSVEVFRLLREAAAQQHQTVVYVTHAQGLAAPGFNDSNYYSKVFVRIKGCAPSVYRKKMRER